MATYTELTAAGVTTRAAASLTGLPRSTATRRRPVPPDLAAPRVPVNRLSPVERQALVRRREETLDELERRDPVGFARWLAEGPVPGADPAMYVHGRPMEGDAAVGTDAA